MTSAVFVTPRIEPAPRAGGEIRTLRLVSALSAVMPVHVVVVAAGDDPPDPEHVRAATGARSVAVFTNDRSPVQKRWTALSQRWPIDWARAWVPAAVPHLRALTQETDATVVIDHVHCWPYRPHARRFVLSTQNIESDVVLAQPPANHLGRRAEQHWDRWRWPKMENMALADPLATVVVVSAVDARRLPAPENARVVPNGTDVPPESPPLPLRGDILFVASLDYPPNLDAVTWWAREIAPLLPPEVPALKVVGRGAELLPRDVAAAVDATGAVPSIEPHLADASVVVIPLRAGGGTRLKLLEALAWGRPVVATTKGAEGVPVEPGADLLIADAAAAFASGTYQLWHDHARASRMAAAGRIVGASFDWSKVAQGFVRIVAGVAGA